MLETFFVWKKTCNFRIRLNYPGKIWEVNYAFKKVFSLLPLFHLTKIIEKGRPWIHGWRGTIPKCIGQENLWSIREETVTIKFIFVLKTRSQLELSWTSFNSSYVEQQKFFWRKKNGILTSSRLARLGFTASQHLPHSRYISTGYFKSRFLARLFI